MENDDVKEQYLFENNLSLGWSLLKMAASKSSAIHDDPNYAVICSFLDKYGDMLGISHISFSDLETSIDDSQHGVYSYINLYQYYKKDWPNKASSLIILKQAT